MVFGEKLDFLMNITSTTNSALAQYISLDASHISRLRSGVRKPPRKENYIRAMAVYLGKHCNEDYQRIALGDSMKIGPVVPTDSEKAAKLIYLWLIDDKIDESNSVQGFLDDLSHVKLKKAPQFEHSGETEISVASEKSVGIYYGVEGKRQAVIQFSTFLLNMDKPTTLLLFSDEDCGWLSESREFTAKWATLLSQAVMRENKIKIIHTVSRNIDEMLSAIGKWLPIYMTGSIEPYYYPKIRDGVYKRTLFIAPKTAAVISTSIGYKVQNSANILIKDQKAVEAFTQEFNSYLALCRPLMRIFTGGNKTGYLKTLTEFDKEEANSIVSTETLSTMTMPVSVALQMQKRLKTDTIGKYMAYHKDRVKLFEKSLINNTFFDIISIPDIKTIREGRAGAAFSESIEHSGLFYTPMEFRLHLQNIVHLLETFDNYSVCMTNNEQSRGYTLYAKEDLGVLVAKSSLPSIIFAINEANMTAAFWDYLIQKTGGAWGEKASKKNDIAWLEAMIRELP